MAMTDTCTLSCWNRDVMDRPVAPLRLGRGPLYLGLAMGGALATLATALILPGSTESNAPAERPVVAPRPRSPADVAAPLSRAGEGPDPPVVEMLGPEIEPRRLADAFEAVTGHRSVFGTHSRWDSVTTEPLRIVQLPFGPVLLTMDTNGETHAKAGAIGVHYLEEENGRFRVKGSWPRAVEGWDWGAAPEWRFTSKFTANPAIYAWGDSMAQGIIGTSATLTELRPEGPITSDRIHTGYDNEGTQESDDEPGCTVKGRIANIHKDRSFDVIVSGSRQAVERFQKKGGRFVASYRIRWDLPCGYSKRQAQ